MRLVVGKWVGGREVLTSHQSETEFRIDTAPPLVTTTLIPKPSLWNTTRQQLQHMAGADLSVTARSPSNKWTLTALSGTLFPH